MPQGLSAGPPTAYQARPGRRPAQTRMAACLSTRNRAAKKTPGPARPVQPAQYGAARTAAGPRTAGGSKPRTAARLAPPPTRRPPPAGQFHDSPKLAMVRAGEPADLAPSGTPYSAFRANSAPARPPGAITLRDSCHGSDVWPPTAARRRRPARYSPWMSS